MQAASPEPVPAPDPSRRPAEDLERLAGGAAISLAGRLVNAALVFAYGIVIARWLGASDAGTLLLALALVRIVEPVCRLGLDLGSVHFVAIAQGAGLPGAVRPTVRRALALSLVLTVAAAVAAFLAAPALSRAFGQPALEPVIRVLALGLPFTTTAAMWLAALLGLKDVARNTIGEKVVVPGLNLLACVLLLAAGAGLAGASAAYVVAAALAVPFIWRQFDAIAPRAASAAPVATPRELLRFSAPVVLVVLCKELLVWTDTLMLGLWRPSSEVGIYGSAMRTALLVGMITASFSAIFVPSISELYHRGELARLAQLYKSVGKWTFLATLPLFFALVLLAPEVLRLFGPDFPAGADALRLLALSHLLAAAGGAVTFMLAMTGRQNLVVLNAATACVLNVLFLAVLVPPLGMLGAAAASCLSTALFNAAALLQVRHLLGMQPYHAGYLRLLAAGCTAFALALAFKAAVGEIHYLAAIVLHGGVCFVLYALLVYALCRDADDELVISRVRRRLGRPDREETP